MMEKLKRYWWAVAGALGAVLAFVFAIVRKTTPVIPARPQLKDVIVSDKPLVNTTPAADYAEKAKAIEVHDRVADANKRYP